MKDTLRVRFRVDFSQLCSIGPGKIQLLEAIAENGSLSSAAREMNMSYRRAWLLMDSMNNSFDKPVVNASTGGNGGGGATITEFGHQLMDAYRTLDKEFSNIAKRHLRTIDARVVRNVKKPKNAVNAKRRSVASSNHVHKNISTR